MPSHKTNKPLCKQWSLSFLRAVGTFSSIMMYPISRKISNDINHHLSTALIIKP